MWVNGRRWQPRLGLAQSIQYGLGNQLARASWLPARAKSHKGGETL